VGYNAELVVSSRHEPGRPQGPASAALEIGTLYPLAKNIGKMDDLISNHHTGASFPISVPVKTIPITEDTTVGFFNPFQITIPLHLELIELFM
jgi:hypothetical protein